MLHRALSQPRSLADLADILGAELIGDGATMVAAVAHPALAQTPETLALAMDDTSFKALAATRATAAVVSGESDLDTGRFAGGLKVERPRLALARLLALFPAPIRATPGVHPSAVVDETADVAPDAAVGALCYVGPGASIGSGAALLPHCSVGAEAVVGSESLLMSGVRLGDRCIVGARCVIHGNAVLGADGFSFVTPEAGSIESAKETGSVTAQNTEIVRINSIGNVEIGDDVEIGANTCIDRGTLGPTRVGKGTKIDNLVQIAHNCRIGENCLIAGMVGLSGSVTVGDRVVFAGGSGAADHITIGDDAIILATSGVGRHVPAKEIWGGTPAAPRDEKAKEIMAIGRLPRLYRDFDRLKQEVAQLKKER